MILAFSSGAENPATPRQPVRHEVVTHVLGTTCYLCLRAGCGSATRSAWRTIDGGWAVTGSQPTGGSVSLPDEDLMLVIPPTRERRRLSHWALSTGANRSENVAALASRAAAIEDEIRVRNPAAATASKMAPKIRVRILHSFMGVRFKPEGKTALFQEGFAISGKEFRSRQSVRGLGWRGGATVSRLNAPSVRAGGFLIAACATPPQLGVTSRTVNQIKSFRTRLHSTTPAPPAIRGENRDPS